MFLTTTFFNSNYASKHLSLSEFSTSCCLSAFKDTFFLRITTPSEPTLIPLSVVYRRSKIHFFCGSQQQKKNKRCSFVVYQRSKIHFFCESQPILLCSNRTVRCLSAFKDTFFLRITTGATYSNKGGQLFISVQRYIFFANHNHDIDMNSGTTVVYQRSKIHFFCESQHCNFCIAVE